MAEALRQVGALRFQTLAPCRLRRHSLRFEFEGALPFEEDPFSQSRAFLGQRKGFLLCGLVSLDFVLLERE